VFTGPPGGRALDVAPGGRSGEPDGGVMLLLVGVSYYRQDTGELVSGGGPFPYPEAAVVRATWGEWRRGHPDTDVYVGELPDESPDGAGRN
jgi:hypothetical protein